MTLLWRTTFVRTVLLKVTGTEVLDAPVHPLTPMKIPLTGMRSCPVVDRTTWTPVRRGIRMLTLLPASLECPRVNLVVRGTVPMVNPQILPLLTPVQVTLPLCRVLAGGTLILSVGTARKLLFALLVFTVLLRTLQLSGIGLTIVVLVLLLKRMYDEWLP